MQISDLASDIHLISIHSFFFFPYFNLITGRWGLHTAAGRNHNRFPAVH